MDDFIELRRVVIIVLRRWWLIVLLTALAATLGYTISRRQAPVYRATTTLLVGQVLQSTNLDRQDILTSDLVALTYSDMIRRQPVLQGVIDSLGLTQTWQQLKGQLRVELVEGTQLIQITVEANSPQTAQMIADEVARQMILFSPVKSGNEENEKVRLFVQQQLENLQARIESGQQRLAAVESEMVTTESAERLSELQSEANTLNNLITDWENNYTQNLVFLNSGQSPSQVTVIEPAQAGSKPVRPQIFMFVIMGGGVGTSLALGLIFLLEFLDDTLKTPEDIARLIGLPVIGFIGDTREFGEFENGTIVSKHPRSPIAESYRSLRANLEFASVDKPLKSILITSCDTGIGKSSISANLAVVIAQSERRVILVDADLRRSSIHELIGVPNSIGLSDIFRNGIEISDTMQVWEKENVRVITSGSSPPNPAELLGSKKMDEILARLQEITDVVIIDSPPFVVSDALPLSAKVDGVLLVMRPGVTRKKYTQTMMDQLDRAGARVVGVVLNRFPHKGPDYYGDYQYFPPYRNGGHYLDEGDVNSSKRVIRNPLGGISQLFRRLFGRRSIAGKGGTNNNGSLSTPDGEQVEEVLDKRDGDKIALNFE
jgi:succinoglycan biosynthesis transport protein ExoP